MLKDIKERLKLCPQCNILNAQRNLAHKYFRARVFSEPRVAYAADYHGVYPNKQGYNNVLGIVDLATGMIHLIPTKGRTAETTASALLYHVILRNGCPRIFHTDAAKEVPWRKNHC